MRATRPDVVLMDIRMPELDGLAATERLMAMPDPPRVVVLTTFDQNEYVVRALRAGAYGFLLKDAPSSRLVAAIRAAAGGDALIEPSITRRLVEQFAVPPAEPAVVRALTERELDVLRLVARGLSNAEIAAEIVVAETTVKTHVARILAKLGVRDRVQAVVLAYEPGFVTLSRRAVPGLLREPGTIPAAEPVGPGVVITQSELMDLSAQERADLAQALRDLGATPAAAVLMRRRRAFLALTAGSALTLLIWVVVLRFTLPPQTPGGAWRTAWIGFDVGEAIAFTLTAWAVWRQRQLAIPAAIVTATLLICDAWFDVTLSWDSDQELAAILSAILFELPLAALMLMAARRLVLVTVTIARSRLGFTGPPPALHRLAIFDSAIEPTRDRAATRSPALSEPGSATCAGPGD